MGENNNNVRVRLNHICPFLRVASLWTCLINVWLTFSPLFYVHLLHFHMIPLRTQRTCLLPRGPMSRSFQVAWRQEVTSGIFLWHRGEWFVLLIRDLLHRGLCDSKPWTVSQARVFQQVSLSFLLIFTMGISPTVPIIPYWCPHLPDRIWS